MFTGKNTVLPATSNNVNASQLINFKFQINILFKPNLKILTNNFNDTRISVSNIYAEESVEILHSV
jgi:hypothetical protein